MKAVGLDVMEPVAHGYTLREIKTRSTRIPITGRGLRVLCFKHGCFPDLNLEMTVLPEDIDALEVGKHYIISIQEVEM